MLDVVGGLSDPEREEDLFKNLEAIINDFISQLNHHYEPTPMELSKEFVKLTNALKSINEIMGFKISRETPRKSKIDIWDIHHYLDNGIAKVIREDNPKDNESSGDQNSQKIYYEIIQSLILLDKSIDATKEIIKEKKSKKIGRTKNIPLRSLIYKLCVVWTEYFGKKPSAHIPGPFIRFIKSYFESIKQVMPELTRQLSVTDVALRDWVSNIKSDTD